MLISGHKSRSVFERYNIVSERDLQEAARRLENYISQMAGAESRNTLGTLLGTPTKPSGQTGEDKLLITSSVRHCAKVAELADAPDLGSGPARGGGSSPPFRTNLSAGYEIFARLGGDGGRRIPSFWKPCQGQVRDPVGPQKEGARRVRRF